MGNCRSSCEAPLASDAVRVYMLAPKFEDFAVAEDGISVAELKIQIQESTGLDPDRQSLFLKDREMPDAFVFYPGDRIRLVASCGPRSRQE